LTAEKVGKKIVNVGHSPYEGLAGNKTNPKRVSEVTRVLTAQRKKIESSLTKDNELKKIIEKYRGDNK